MKRTKKLLALVLAVMMAFTTLVMPAMAADEDEGIMPLYEVTFCPKCDGVARVTRSVVSDYWPASNCTKSIMAHLHFYDTLNKIRTVCINGDYDVTTYVPVGNGICPLSD